MTKEQVMEPSAKSNSRWVLLISLDCRERETEKIYAELSLYRSKLTLTSKSLELIYELTNKHEHGMSCQAPFCS